MPGWRNAFITSLKLTLTLPPQSSSNAAIDRTSKLLERMLAGSRSTEKRHLRRSSTRSSGANTVRKNADCVCTESATSMVNGLNAAIAFPCHRGFAGSSTRQRLLLSQKLLFRIGQCLLRITSLISRRCATNAINIWSNNKCDGRLQMGASEALRRRPQAAKCCAKRRRPEKSAHLCSRLQRPHGCRFVFSLTLWHDAAIMHRPWR